MTLTDHLYGRRMALRQILTTWGDERYQAGYGDGIRDVHAAQHKARNAEREAEAEHW